MLFTLLLVVGTTLQLETETATGSGVLLKPTWLLTAAHVVPVGGGFVSVKCGARTIIGETRQQSQMADLALVELQTPCTSPPVSLATSIEPFGTRVTLDATPKTSTKIAMYEAVPKFGYMALVEGYRVQPGMSGGGIRNAAGKLAGIIEGEACYTSGCYTLVIPATTICEFLGDTLNACH